ncbi:hypothetical protein [Haloarcula litorea]|uniref:hypothetical protein n=1 Tax=Haloarcula litorea TaxID=3032579 RepID=UPI0023E88E26|nr:hypothetical protein [Halomicroarcula sp. GDY20]
MSTPTTEAGGDDAYNGLPGAFVYALRASDSLLFRAYLVAALLLSLAITLVFVFGLITVLGATAGARGGTFTFSRSFVLFVGLLVVAPLLAPVLLVARRHRRTGSSVAYDRGLALSGVLFVLSLYVGLVISAPPGARDPAGNAVVAALYALPQLAGLVPPLLAAAGVYVAHRLLR